MKFDLPKDQASIIKVIGVGGGGSNAVNHMFKQGITGVDFVICNTDAQALDLSDVPNKIQLGTTLTEGLGAGADPEVGRNSVIEDAETIKSILQNNTKMIFITAGMGGGTGTGAAPIIAETSREMGILTVGIVTMPFSFEGRRRKEQADKGIAALRTNVDTLLIINNDKLRMMYGNLKMGEAFAKADDILTIAAKGISEIITVTGYVNTDFKDVQTVMRNGGTAIMGSASAEGENRAIEAISKALTSPLLNDNEIKGAKYVLLNITSGTEEITMDEIGEITDYIQEESEATADVIWGNCTDESLGEKIAVTVIATGFGANETTSLDIDQQPQKKVYDLDEEVSTTITQTLDDDNTINNIEEKQTEQPQEPTIDFKDSSKEKDNKQKVIFNLDDDNQEIDAKRDDISLNFDELNKSETESKTTNEDTDDWMNDADDTDKIKAVEDSVVVWNLNDDDSTDEVTNEDADFTVDEAPQDDFKLSKKDNSELTENKPVYTNRIPDEEQLKRSQERVMRIKELGVKMKTPSGINDLEKEPAFKRRKIDLNETPQSSESNISRFTLSDDEDGKPKLNDDNSFLHDNVD